MGVPGAGALAPPTFRRLDIALLVTLGVVWGIAYVFIREGILAGASPLLFAAVRYVISGAGFALVAGLRREPWPSRRALAASMAIGGTLVIGLYGGLLYSGEALTTGGYASVLSATAPVLSVVFAAALLPSERLSPLALGGIALGFAGVVLLVVPEIEGGVVGTWPGPLIVTGAFVSAAAGSVLLRRYGGGPQGLWQIGAQFAVGAAVLAGPIAFGPGREVLPWTGPVLLNLAGLVVLSSMLGYFVYFALHHRVGPVRANAVTYLLPLVGVGVGSGVYGEPITVFEVVGFVVVLAGVSLILRGSMAPKAPEGPGPARSTARQ